MSKVEITTPHPEYGPGSAQVIVDGHDLSHALSHYEVEQTGSGLPKVTLALHRVEDKRLCMAVAEVVLDSATQDFLEAAGWTPPAIGEEAGK